ncbi:MAG: hypothetical protein HC838_10925 [Spirulinaceae cyanobacterium RM2_2_10]|nr:hypothetical protein [Spirulinaceae cyanobacterium RM2_2_10]
MASDRPPNADSTPDDPLAALEQERRRRQAAGDVEGEAEILMQQAIFYSLQGEWPRSLACLDDIRQLAARATQPAMAARACQLRAQILSLTDGTPEQIEALYAEAATLYEQAGQPAQAAAVRSRVTDPEPSDAPPQRPRCGSHRPTQPDGQPVQPGL